MAFWEKIKKAITEEPPIDEKIQIAQRFFGAGITLFSLSVLNLVGAIELSSFLFFGGALIVFFIYHVQESEIKKELIANAREYEVKK